MKNIFYKLRCLESVVPYDEDDVRSQLFESVKKFVYSGCYSSYRGIKSYLKVATATDKEVARVLGIKEPAVRQVRGRVSKEALKVIGENTFNVIEFGTIKEVKLALRNFKFAEKVMTSEDLFYSEFISGVEECKLEDVEFTVSDCKYELTLLHWLSRDKIKNLLSCVDADRLSYLLKVIDGKVGTAEDKMTVLRVVLADDLLTHALPEDKSKFRFPPMRPDDSF